MAFMAVIIDDSNPRLDDPDFPGSRRRLHTGFDKIFVNQVIIVKEQKILSLGLFQTIIIIPDGADILGVLDIDDPWIVITPHHCLGMIAGAIIGYSYFDIVIGLL
jgi:hypothetical protein